MQDIQNLLNQVGIIVKKNNEILDVQFIELNKGYLNPSELKQENDLRNIRVQLLYDRLARTKS